MPSKRRQDEEQPGASEGRLRAVLDAALDAVIGMDARDVITYWNPRAESIFGWTREEALGKHLRDLIIPERYREAHTRGMAHFLATGQGPVLGRRIELHGLRRDGTGVPRRAVDHGGEGRRVVQLQRLSRRHHRAQARGGGAAPLCRRLSQHAGRGERLVPPGPQGPAELQADLLQPRGGPLPWRPYARTCSEGGWSDTFPHMLETDLPRQYRDVVLSGEGPRPGRGAQDVRRAGRRRRFLRQGLPVARRLRAESPLRTSPSDGASRSSSGRRRRWRRSGSLAGGIAHDFNNLLTRDPRLQRVRSSGELDAAIPRARRWRRSGKAGERASPADAAAPRLQPQAGAEPGGARSSASVITDLASMLRRLIGEDVVLETIVGPRHRRA